MTTILVMMVVALFSLANSELSTTQHHRDRVAALYLAEAGIADAMQQLKTDPSWNVGFTDKSIPGVDGSYSCQFNTLGPPYLPSESTNNTDGNNPNNHAGKDKVPTGCVDLVITARVRGATRTVEALVETSEFSYPANSPLLTDGRIVLRGNVLVDAIRSQSTSEPIDGNVHSNLASGDSDLITWNGVGKAHITGEVSSSGTSSSAIDLSGYTPDGGAPSVNAAPVSFPDVDILAQISQASTNPAPTVNSVGTTTLSGAPQQYFDGDLDLQGDLILDDVNLYVTGNLNINGSIKGKGSVYVGGNTDFKGDAEVATMSPDKVALFGHGNVHLSGFDGTEFMNALSTDPEIDELWKQTTISIGEFKNLLSADDVKTTIAQNGPLDQKKQLLGGAPPNMYGAGTKSVGDKILGNNIAGSTVVLKERLQKMPASSSRDFMMERFAKLDEAFYNELPGPEPALLANAKKGIFSKGTLDAIIDRWNTSLVAPSEKDDLIKNMRTYVSRLHPDRVGSSYFQGLVFTHGSILASNEVTVLGAMVAKGDPSLSTVSFEGETLKPGDIFLTNNSQMTFVEDYFYADKSKAGRGILLWMAR